MKIKPVTLSSVLSNAETCTNLPRQSIDELKAEYAALVAVAEAAANIHQYAEHGNLHANEMDPWGTTYTATVRSGHYASLGLALRELAQCAKNLQKPVDRVARLG